MSRKPVPSEEYEATVRLMRHANAFMVGLIIVATFVLVVFGGGE